MYIYAIHHPLRTEMARGPPVRPPLAPRERRSYSQTIISEFEVVVKIIVREFVVKFTYMTVSV